MGRRKGLGVNKILAKVRERFYWVYCREDVERWCWNYTHCAATKGLKTRSRGILKECNVGAPSEKVVTDIAGLLPTTNDGNKYILVFIDLL